MLWLVVSCFVLVWQHAHVLLPTIKFVAEVDINDVPLFYLTDICYRLYPSLTEFSPAMLLSRHYSPEDCDTQIRS